MMKKLQFKTAIITTSLVLAGLTAYTYNSQAPANANGSPASSGNTCASSSCHSGPAITDQTVTITTDIPVTGFLANTMYNITVTGNLGTTSALTSGFEASVESPQGFEGTLSAPNANVKLVGLSTFASHDGKQSFTANETEWTFQWNSGNSPAGTKVYAAVNFANDNGATSGDAISTTSLALTKDIGVSIDENILADVSIYPNPTSDFLNVNFATEKPGLYKLDLFDLSGKQLIELSNENIGSSFNRQFDVSNLNSGIYILTISGEGRVSRQKITIQ